MYKTLAEIKKIGIYKKEDTNITRCRKGKIYTFTEKYQKNKVQPFIKC